MSAPRRFAIASALLVLLIGFSAHAEELTVLTKRQMTELRAEAKLQLTDARRVHRGMRVKRAIVQWGSPTLEPLQRCKRHRCLSADAETILAAAWLQLCALG